MTSCRSGRGCVNVGVHKSSAKGIGTGDHAVLQVSVGLGPNDHIEGLQTGETLGAVEWDLSFSIAVGCGFDRLPVLCSLRAA